MIFDGPKIVRPRAVPWKAIEWRWSNTTSWRLLSTSCISRRITPLSRSISASPGTEYHTKHDVTAPIRKQKYTGPMKLLLHNKWWQLLHFTHWGYTTTCTMRLVFRSSVLLCCGSQTIWDTGKHMHNNTVAHPSTLQSSALMLWKPHTFLIQ